MIMKRSDKYPDTPTFCYYNANPKNRITGDCAYRAISLATGLDYNDVVMKLAEIHVKTGYEPTMTKGLDAFMKSIGWIKHNQPRKADNTKFTGKEFCELLNLDPLAIGKRILCNIGGHHMVCIMETKGLNGRFKVHDIWNSTGGCVGNYWTPPR